MNENRYKKLYRYYLELYHKEKKEKDYYKKAFKHLMLDLDKKLVIAKQNRVVYKDENNPVYKLYDYQIKIYRSVIDYITKILYGYKIKK